MKIVMAMSAVGVKTGVPEKIARMITTLEALGHNVCYYPFAHCGAESHPVLKKRTIVSQNLHNGPNKFSLQRILQVAALLKETQADIIFYRYDRSFLNFFSCIFSGLPVITEHNTIEYSELAKGCSLKTRVKEGVLGFVFRALSAGLVGVTNEILHYEQRKAILPRPGLVLANSIQVNDYAVYKKGTVSKKRLVFVGVPEKWQGLDRLVKTMATNEMKEFELLVVGDSTPQKFMQQASLDVLPGNVRFLGPLFGQDLHQLLLTCDIGVGSLGVHRKGLREACPLKVRQYVALGLPVIIGYQDPDLPDGLPFVLKVSQGEQLISPTQIVEFYHQLSHIDDIGTKVHEHAFKTMDSSVAMQRLVTFFGSFVDVN